MSGTDFAIECYLFYDRVDYLGYDISTEGVRPGSLKIQSVADFPKPAYVHQQCPLLGLISYFRNFVQAFNIIAKHLTKLTAKYEVWVWTTQHNVAFVEIKKQMIQKPVLRYFLFEARTEVHTDVSRDGLRAILLQEQVSGEFLAFVYASQLTIEYEERHHSHKLETLAVVWALEKFWTDLIGLKFTVVTDCNAVRATLIKKDLLPQIGRWWHCRQELTFDIE